MSFEAFLGFLAFKHSAGIKWEDVRCRAWFPYKDKIGDVLNIPER